MVLCMNCMKNVGCPQHQKTEKYRLDNEMLELSKTLKVPKNIERVK